MGLYDDISNSLVPSPLDYGYVPPFPSQGAMPEPYQSIYPPGYVRQAQPPYTDFINPPIHPYSGREGLLTRYPVGAGVSGDYDSLIGGNLPQQANYPAITVDPGYTSNWLGAPGGAPAGSVGDAGLQGGGGGAGSYPTAPGVPAMPPGGGMMGDPGTGLGAGGRSGAGGLGLLSAGLGILAQSGWQPGKGVTVGQALGIGGAQGVQTYLVAKQQEERAAIAREQIASMNVMRRAQMQDLAEKTASRQRTNQLMRQLATAKTQEERLAVLNQLYPEEALKAELHTTVVGENQKVVRGNGEVVAVGPLHDAFFKDTGLDSKDPANKKLYSDWLDKKTQFAPKMEVNVKVDTQIPASEQAQKQLMDETRTSYNSLKSAPFLLQNIEEAKALAPKAFMGSFAEQKKAIAKFFNNNLGTNINSDAVASTEELKTRLFQSIMENLKKMDAQPSQLQQQIMMESLGEVANDPKALPRILNVMRDSVRQKVEVHNRDVKTSIERGVKYPYDPLIELPKAERKVIQTGVDKTTGKKVYQYDDGSVEAAP